jgi:hypothetical protein
MKQLGIQAHLVGQLGGSDPPAGQFVGDAELGESGKNAGRNRAGRHRGDTNVGRYREINDAMKVLGDVRIRDGNQSWWDESVHHM